MNTDRRSRSPWPRRPTLWHAVGVLWFGAGLLVLLVACLTAAVVSDVRALRRGSGLRDPQRIDSGVYEFNKIVGAAREPGC